MEFGYSLIPLVDEKSGGKLISRIVIFRRQYAQDMGFVIPSIRLHDGAALGTNQYVIKIRGRRWPGRDSGGLLSGPGAVQSGGND